MSPAAPKGTVRGQQVGVGCFVGAFTAEPRRKLGSGLRSELSVSAGPGEAAGKGCELEPWGRGECDRR